MSIKISSHPRYVTFDLFESQYGTVSLLTENMKIFYSCIQVDEMFFAQCFKVEKLENIKFVGCSWKIQKNKDFHKMIDNEEYFNIIFSKDTIFTKKNTHLQFPCESHDKPVLDATMDSNEPYQKNKPSTGTMSTRTSLENWMKYIDDPLLFGDHFTTSFNPINPTNPIIDIALPQFFDQKVYNILQRYVTIETLNGKLLFNGPLNKEKLSLDTIKHPGWRARLKIKISMNIDNKKSPTLIINGILKNGKLHGLVQIYGVLPLDLNGYCKKVNFDSNSLSFIGKYENGMPIGTCWRRLVGGAWMYGNVNRNGEFTGSNDIAYIYPDLELAMVGQFKNGLLVIITLRNECHS